MAQRRLSVNAANENQTWAFKWLHTINLKEYSF